MITLLIHALEAYWNYHKNIIELERLSDYELHDIGISRTDIPFIASGGSKQAS